MAVGAGRIFAINLIANSDPAQKAFADVGRAAGRLPTPMKIAAAAITAVFAAVAAVAVKSFRALLDLGEEFNEVTRIIRVGTGAVGGDLAALEQSFREVASAVPSSFTDIANVVAELDTRTNLAGEGLEEMATQLLTLSRLMGGDARSTTREVTRLFNRFGLEADEASKMLDVLFRASQASGASVDQLATEVTKNAGALQGMGLSLEESVALFAIFEREGVRSRTVVSALQTGFLRLTKDGTLPLNEALADTFRELQSLDREAAIAKGLEIFGTSALELVDAVRDGRLSVEDFTRQIVEGEDTIIGVAGETDGWRQKLDELRNFLKLQFEPAAREVFRRVTEFVDQLRPAAERVAAAFEKDGLKGALQQVAEEWQKIYNANIKPLFETLLDFIDREVKPRAVAAGEAVGEAILRGIATAFKNGVRGLFFGDEADLTFNQRLVEELRGWWNSILGRVDMRLPDMGAVAPSLPAPRPPAPAPAPAPPRRDQPVAPPRPTAPTTPRPVVPQLPTLPPGQQWGQGGLPAIPGLATGGIVMSPTLALIGEAGPEAVVPLDRYGSGGMGTTIVLNVQGAIDPEGTARTILRTLRDAERRTGERLFA